MNIPADVLRLEREALELAARVASLEQRHAATEQQAGAQWYNPFWAGPPAAPTGNFTATGQVNGCAGMGVPSCTVTIVDASTAAVYATAITDATGHFSTSGTIPASPTNVRVNLTPGDTYAARFAPYPGWATTVSFGSNVLNVTAFVPLGLASGYHCSGLAYFPLAATLHMTDSVIGAVDLVWPAVGPTGWVGVINYAVSGLPGQRLSGRRGTARDLLAGRRLHQPGRRCEQLQRDLPRDRRHRAPAPRPGRHRAHDTGVPVPGESVQQHHDRRAVLLGRRHHADPDRMSQP